MNKFIEIEVSKLVKADWNYKEEDPKMQKQLVENIRKNGQLENIIVRQLGNGKYEVVNGNHRLDAFKELKFAKVTCCDVGEISEAHAARIAIETNETKFKSDNIKLAQLLENIKSDFDITELQKTMPFSLDEMTNMQSLIKFDWNTSAMSSDSSLSSPDATVTKIPTIEQPPQKQSPQGAAVDPHADNRTIMLKLPVDIAEDWEAQILRLKKLLFPEDLPEHVSNVLIVQAILQLVSETEDSKFH